MPPLKLDCLFPFYSFITLKGVYILLEKDSRPENNFPEKCLETKGTSTQVIFTLHFNHALERFGFFLLLLLFF